MGEVGMNCMVMQFGKEIIPIDAGILFANPNDFGIESLHPDYKKLILEYKPKYWIITHAHEDHIGAVSGIFQACRELGLADVPEILAPPFSAELIKEKCLDDQGVGSFKQYVHKIKSVSLDTWIELIPGLKAIWIEGRHSTLESCSIGFEWSQPDGREPLRVIHSSDYKIDKHEFEDGVIDSQKYRVFGDSSPDVLFIDSTNAEREGHSVSEAEIRKGLEAAASKIEGRIYVSLFSSNVFRIATLAQIANKLGRKVCLAGRSMQTAFRVASDLGILGVKTPSVEGVHFVSLDEINRLKPEQQFIICSGSQGENRSTLMRLGLGTHADLGLDTGDAVILSSKVIPGNERTISRMVNNLIRMGAQIVWGELGKKVSDGLPIHASGHARRDELRDLIRSLKPKTIVPVHGELRQLEACAGLAREMFEEYNNHLGEIWVVENGTKLHFNPQGDRWVMIKKESVEDPGRVLRFDSFTSPSRDPFLWVRKRAALGGVVSVVLNSEGDVSVKFGGIFPAHISIPVREIEKWVASKYPIAVSAGAFKGLPRETLEQELTEDLERFVKRVTGMKPVCHFHLVGQS